MKGDSFKVSFHAPNTDEVNFLLLKVLNPCRSSILFANFVFEKLRTVFLHNNLKTFLY